MKTKKLYNQNSYVYTTSFLIEVHLASSLKK